MSPRARQAALWLLIPLMLFGIFVGGLMTWHHDTQLYGGPDAQGQLIGCAESEEVNCDVVNTSRYSELAGVPIATLAVPFYGTVLLLAILALRGREGARALIVGAGVGAALYSAFLFGVSKLELKYVCAWCMRLYGVNISILVLGLLAGRPVAPERPTLILSAGAYAALLLLSLGGEAALRAQLIGEGGVELAEAAPAAEDGAHGVDPRGPAPALAFTVETEDKNQRTLQIEADDPWRGAAGAKVAVVMFGDLECGYCKRTSAEIKRLEANYSDQVLFVYKHYPMDPACNPGVKNPKHKEACAAAVASVCAQDQGKFWAFHDIAYKNQHRLDAAALRAYAAEVGLALPAFEACLADPAAKARVQADAAAGAALDIHGTPRVFINGALYRAGSSAVVMARALELALGASAAEAAARSAALADKPAALPPVPLDAPATRPVSLGALRFDIDTFEASVVDGAARSARHQVPALRVSWYEAKAACEAAGRRMCTEAEWLSACQGAVAVDDDNNGVYADDLIEGNTYPYGELHERGRCWDGQRSEESRPAYTGELPGCLSPVGAYDLTGNLEEWVGATPETAALMGGAFDTSDDHARCARRNASFGAGFASPRTGFRCCGG